MKPSNILELRKMKQYINIRTILTFIIVAVLLISCSKSQKPIVEVDNLVAITHITNPAISGKLSVIVGDGWDVSAPIVKVMKLENSPIMDPSKKMVTIFDEEESVTCSVEKNNGETLICGFSEGNFSAYAVAAKGEKGWSEPYVVNTAKGQWLSKESASAGDTIRIFGRNLVNLDLYPKTNGYKQSEGYGAYLNKIASQIEVESPDGEFFACKVIRNSAYDVSFVLPSSITEGKWKVYAHNGLGGKYGWSEPLILTVVEKKQWPTKVFNVKDFGAVGVAVENEEGWNDDAPAIQKALDAAAANKGGVVYFPVGNYYVAQTLVIPRNTVVQGESRERCWIWFPDAIDHGKRHDFEAAGKVEVGIRGTSDFTLENLSIHSVYTNVLVGAPLINDSLKTYETINVDKKADNVSIINCNLVHEPYYRYHHRKEDPFLLQSSQVEESWGMKATVALHGDNINIINSSIRGGGVCIVLITSSYSNIANNELIMGRAGNALATREFGYPKLPCTQKVIFEDNNIWPATPVHHGGLWSHKSSTDFYVARNTLQMTWGCDSEGFLWHGTGHEKAHVVASATESTITAKGIDEKNTTGWQCIVVRGKGLGQKRIVKEIKGKTLILDKPWKIIPGEGSRIGLHRYHVHEGHIIVQNKLADTGAGIFCWGGSFDWIVDGNSMERGGGVVFDECAYTPTRAWSGNYFHQILNNRVDQGRFNNHVVGKVWTIGYSGTGGYREFNGGVISHLGHIYRGNLSTNDAAISFWDRVTDKNPDNYKGSLIDVGMVVEDNWFKDCNLGISVSDGVSGVVRGNNFNNVDTKIRVSPEADIFQE